MNAAQDLPPRIRKFVSLRPDGGCWDWIGGKSPGGYGRVRFQGRNALAHRVVYTLLAGPIEPGLCIDHQCRNRACCNPEHLRAVTPIVNAMENSLSVTALNAAKTHCYRGHPFTPENTVTKRGSRTCRTCRRAYKRRLKLRKRQERRA